MQKIINPSPNTATTAAYPMATIIISGAVFTFPIMHVMEETSSINMTYTLENNEDSFNPFEQKLNENMWKMATGQTHPTDLEGNDVTKPPSMLSIIASDRVQVHLRFTTGSDFFVNSYTVFKTALELLAYAQQKRSNQYALYNLQKKMEINKPDKSNMSFISYFGANEYLVYGQIESITFNKSIDTNAYDVYLTMQRRDFYNNGFRSKSGEELKIPK